MSENGEIYTAGKTFTLPPAVTALTNSTSASPRNKFGFRSLILADFCQKFCVFFYHEKVVIFPV